MQPAKGMGGDSEEIRFTLGCTKAEGRTELRQDGFDSMPREIGSA